MAGAAGVVIRCQCPCHYNDETRRGDDAMNGTLSKLPIYVLSGVYYLMTAPRTVRKLQRKLRSLV